MSVIRRTPDTMTKPFGSYCQVARRGNIVTTAGVAAIDREGRIVGGDDIVAQTRATLENLRLALEAGGASLEDVLKVTVFLSDFANYKGFNLAFDEFFKANPPARSTVRADLVLPELLVEIEAIAVLSDAGS